MTKSLLEIAKENGAFIVKDEVGEDLVLPVENLQATIDVVNAQNKGTLECRFTYLIDELKKLLGLDENYMLLSSAPIESKLISLLEEKLNAANAQESDPVGYVSSIPISNPAAIRKDKNESLSIPVFAAPQTLPPEWAEYVGRLERALENYSEKAISIKRYLESKPTQEKGVFAVVTELSLDGGSKAQEAISRKPKDR